MKTALITGCRRGLGKELCNIFSFNEYNLILNAKHNNDVYNNCNYVIGDINHDNTINKLYDACKFTGIDVLINNVGIYDDTLFLENSINNFTNVINTNFISIVKLTHKILPLMIEKKEGIIININSIAGKNGSNRETAYSASKHALKGFSDSLQFEITKLGIKILNVYLGAMQTDMTINRKEYKKLIDPADAAKTIFNMVNQPDSLRITEIEINRNNY